jgi:hypothetical protein
MSKSGDVSSHNMAVMSLNPNQRHAECRNNTVLYTLYTSFPTRSNYFISFSNSSFASLTLVARYGLPPRSGWLFNIRPRCFFRSSSFVTPRSLPFVSTLMSSLVVRIGRRRTAFRGSGLLLSESSWARNRLYSNSDLARRRLHLSDVLRRVLHGPVVVVRGG